MFEISLKNDLNCLKLHYEQNKIDFRKVFMKVRSKFKLKNPRIYNARNYIFALKK